MLPRVDRLPLFRFSAILFESNEMILYLICWMYILFVSADIPLLFSLLLRLYLFVYIFN